MFLLYINDDTTNINSPLRIFADDCLLYRIIDTPEDTAILQKDLDRIASWVISCLCCQVTIFIIIITAFVLQLRKPFLNQA